MELIELHILQSFPVTCLNRDDLGSPKSAVFGGTPRARISSQCLKRAHRELFSEELPAFSQGVRTKLLVKLYQDYLSQKEGILETYPDLPKQLAELWGKLDAKKKDAEGLDRASTLTYLSTAEVAATAEAALQILQDPGVDAKKKSSLVSKAFLKAIKQTNLHDAADIALFGRMVASEPALNVEGAAMFSHALSTHRAEPEMDFYAAVDDAQGDDSSGAGMTGILEYNSACYYRYIGLNLTLLRQNMPTLTPEELQTIVSAFVRTALISVPSARKNSMNGATLPGYVLGTYRATGQPLQLVNAFEAPIKSNSGYLAASREALTAELHKLESTWGIKPAVTACLPDIPLTDFISALTQPIA